MRPRDSYQDPAELAAFISLLKTRGIKSFLEVGSKYGDTLYAVGMSMPPRSRVVSVDLERNGDDLSRRIAELCQAGYDAQLIAGNSTKPATIEQARALGPYDAIFIDGDHKLPGLKADWENYGPMARIVAFHDIAWKRESLIQVGEFWNELKAVHRHCEIKMHPDGDAAGIGVLWRW